MSHDQTLPTQEFRPIRVASLRGDLKIPFNVYVRVAGKHILYCRMGDSFEGARLNRLRSKKLKNMFIREDDEIPYRQYLESSIDSAYDRKSGKPLEVRVEVIQGFQQAAAEEYMEDALDHLNYSHVRSSVERFANFLQAEPEAVRALLSIQNSDQSVSHHGVSVATLSVSMAQENKLVDGIKLHQLAFGCLIHDIESYLEDSKVGRKIDTLAPGERKAFLDHPILGAHRLQGAKFIEQMVMNVILQHEENARGTGYPKGLTEKDMDPLVMIVATANAYDRLVSFEHKSPKEALKELLIQMMGIYPLSCLQALQTVLKRQGLLT